MDKYYNQTRNEMLKFIPDQGVNKVLDVGCGQGGFASLIKERIGAEVWGIEPVRGQAEKASEALDKVLLGGFEDVYADLLGNEFDCIIFNDVLEHIIDPWSVLEKTRTLLSSNGVIVCSIPNVRYFPHLWELLIRRDWRYRDSGILDRTHLRFFTHKSIRRMFSEYGYIEKSIVGINPFKSKKMILAYAVANIIMLGALKDARHQQFACVMKPKNDGN